MSQGEISKQNFDKRFRDILNSSGTIFTSLTRIFEKLLDEELEDDLRNVEVFRLQELAFTSKQLCLTIRDLLKNEELRSYILVRMHNQSLQENLLDIGQGLTLNFESRTRQSSQLQFRIRVMSRDLSQKLTWIENFIQYISEKRATDIRLNDIQANYDSAVIELRKYQNSTKNKSAVELYTNVNSDFLKLEKKYRNYFLISIISTLVLAVTYDPLIGIGGNLHSFTCSINVRLVEGCSALAKANLYPFSSDTLKYILYKLAVLVVGVTLTTYFLRLSSFYQIKQEQAKQTKLELEAFPDYVSGMDESVANNLRQELALKYFGKEIDKTLIDKNGDLLQEQIKAGTELIKASTDVVKTVKSSGDSSKTEDQDK